MAHKREQTPGELGEFGLIEHLLRLIHPAARAAHFVGAGDDCAVIPNSAFGAAQGLCLWTTDIMVEGRHFSREYLSAEDIGAKLCAVNISDIAAMGGSPTAGLITLQLPAATPLSLLEGIYRGIDLVAAAHGLALLGGDTTAGAELALGMTVLGTVSGRPLLRSRAEAGDDLWLSGEIGLAALGLWILEGRPLPEIPASVRTEALNRHRRPVPRVALGRLLVDASLAGAAIDVSDGLLQDLSHIASASGVSCVVEPEKVPFGAEACRSAELLVAALAGGDDYELLFTAPQANRTRLEALGGQEGIPKLSRIGSVSAEPNAGSVRVRLGSGEELPLAAYLQKHNWSGGPGYQHFSNRR